MTRFSPIALALIAIPMLAACGERVRVGRNVGTDGGPGDAAVDGPFVHIHFRSTVEPFAHMDGLASQTPRAMSGGMRSYSVLRSMDDPTPALVFDYGDGYQEVGYDGGDDTIVASVPARALTGGTFAVGRVVLTHTRYTVDAVVHTAGMNIPGEIEGVVVLSDRTTIDGVMRDRGYNKWILRAGGMEFPQEGTGLFVPEFGSGGFSVRIEDGETAYYFPANLAVVPDITSDVDMVLEANMHECFRWEDSDMAGYGTGVFDVTPAGYELVRQFGANSFVIIME